MSPITKQFTWQNRDTAARDLLQLAYFAPSSIRRRALQLLKAFRSEAILPELKQLVIDEERDTWERRYALRAIASIRGDIYLPEFAHLERFLGFGELLRLAEHHPSNLQWVFQNIELLQPKEYLQVLRRYTYYFGRGEGFNPLLCQRMIDVLEVNPSLLDLELVDTLYYRGGSETVINWLQERWDTLIYLCAAGETKEVFSLLEGWEQLREAVFKDCPSIIEEYNHRKAEVEFLRQQHRITQVDYQSSAIWQELDEWYQSALKDNKQAYGKLVQVVYHERDNLCKRAVATNLLGKLKDKYDVRAPLFHAIRYAPDDPQYEHLAMNTSIRFEAGEALRDIPSPDVLETMVDAFFIRPRNVLESFMSDWIEYLTDRLSGLDAPYTGMKWGDEQHRFWFRALLDTQKDENS